MADQNQAQPAGMQGQLPLDLPSIILGLHAATLMSQLAQNKSAVQGGNDQQASGGIMGLLGLQNILQPPQGQQQNGGAPQKQQTTNQGQFDPNDLSVKKSSGKGNGMAGMSSMFKGLASIFEGM